MRRIGSLTGIADDSMTQARLATFLQRLQQLGWTVGRNVQIDRRWGGGDADRIRKDAAELVTLAPDVILATGAPATQQLLRATRTVPIVFVLVPDPVGSGFVESLARPGGNATGFMHVRIRPEREMAGTAQRDCARRDASGGPSGSHHTCRDRPVRRNPVGGAVARRGGEPDLVRDAAEIERAITAFARSSNGGLIVTASSLAVHHRSDHHAGGPAQTARGLLRTALRCRRRPDFLWR